MERGEVNAGDGKGREGKDITRGVIRLAAFIMERTKFTSLKIVGQSPLVLLVMIAWWKVRNFWEIEKVVGSGLFWYAAEKRIWVLGLNF